MTRRRSCPILLILAVLATGGCARAFDNIYDFDGDGSLDEHDCDSTDPSIYPGAPDTFGDDIDQDCDGSDGVDLDGDGYPSLLSGGTDCVDTDPELNPADTDEDGFSTCDGDCDDADATLNLLDADGDHYSSCTGDCNDGNFQQNPEQEEVCDLLDNDCDGVQADDEVDVDLDGDPACNDCDDNDALVDHLDLDGDSFSLCDGDCIDDPAQAGSELIYPAATDLVANGIDNNCDGSDGVDGDRDLHATIASGGDDCDDAIPSIFTGAADSWGNAVDEDCDGCDPSLPPVTDANGNLLSRGDGIDTDCDGYAYNGPGTDRDCNDTVLTTYPGAPDTVGDITDNNCDGIDGTDADGDQHASLASLGDDCDDTAQATYPGAPDILDEYGIDTDCDDCDSNLPAVVDASGAIHIRGDGVDSDCDGYAQNGPGFDQDCNDDDAAIYPGSTEVWESVAQPLDTNCDGDLYNPLSGADAFFVGEHAVDWGGYSVSSAGDVDGDGLSDLLIGAYLNSERGQYAGKSYLFFGSTIHAQLLAPPNDRTFQLGNADASFVGEDSGDFSGISVSSAGDVDGDGLGDLLIGAYLNGDGGDDAGKSYLFFGSTVSAQLAADPTNNSFNLSQADASFVGENGGDKNGRSVSSAGDVDGDGLGDLLIGANGNDDGGTDAGKTYLFFGSSIAAGGSFDLSAADASFVGEHEFDYSGSSVSSAGDIDGDGVSDLLIGAQGNDDSAVDSGKSYLVRASTLAAQLLDDPQTTVFSLADIDAAFVGHDTSEESGQRVASAGDLNGDCRDDLLTWACQ
jgi:hypothetical protein